MSFIVAQLGARMHYAVPRSLWSLGLLEHLYTDICATKGLPRFLRIIPPILRSASIKRLLGRIPDIPNKKITAFTSFGYQYVNCVNTSSTSSERSAAFLWGGQKLCELVLQHGFGQATGVYTYNSAGLEILRHARDRGIKTVMEQTIAPIEIEHQLLMQEQDAFPDWEEPLIQDKYRTQLAAREQAEWEQADVILCGSEFVRDGIKACGGPGERCIIVPYGVDSYFQVTEKPLQSRPLRVLTIGVISLRKGSPYVMAAAKALKGTAEFRMVGSSGILPDALQCLHECIDVLGPISRTEILSQYAWADVFLLPSLCEGSATVCYEALACGLPVITTSNTGSVVREGVDGFIVSIRDPEAIVQKLQLLAAKPQLLQAMSRQAHLRSLEYTVKAYGTRLIQAIK